MIGSIKRSVRGAAKKVVFPALSVLHRLGPRAGSSVLLTFDDGPHPELTPAVLERLEHYGARAVFFVIGDRVSRAPSVLHQILKAGHRVGNHSFAHDRTTDPMTDLARCQDILTRETGVRPDLYRPPEGRITWRRLRAAHQFGLTTVHWSIERSDWALREEVEALECGHWFAREVQPRDIILLHDDNPWILTALDILLPALVRRKLDMRRAVGLL